MSGMTCDVTGCAWNDGNGSCECDGIYISDAETGDPMCMSALFPEDNDQDLGRNQEEGYRTRKGH